MQNTKPGPSQTACDPARPPRYRTSSASPSPINFNNSTERPTLSQALGPQDTIPTLLSNSNHNFTKRNSHQHQAKPRQEYMPPASRDTSTQTQYDSFDNPMCLQMPTDLRGWSYSRLSKMSINDLQRLCETRNISSEASIRHMYVHHLIDWKQQLKSGSQESSRRSSLHIPFNPKVNEVMQQKPNLHVNTSDSKENSDNEIMCTPIPSKRYLAEPPTPKKHKNTIIRPVEDDQDCGFEVKELFFDDLSLDEKKPLSPKQISTAKKRFSLKHGIGK